MTMYLTSLIYFRSTSGGDNDNLGSAVIDCVTMVLSSSSPSCYSTMLSNSGAIAL
jgi:hypothetical protein